MTNKIVVKNYSIEKIGEMQDMANVLKKHIIQNKLYTSIQSKNYVHVEGWTFAGGLMGLIPRITSVENMSTGTEYKWRANAEIVNIKTGQVMGVGIAICSTKESKKKSFDEYAVLSMAQTRAIGKAYRNLIGWVMKLTGYEATPSEEMQKMGETPKEEYAETVIQVETEPQKGQVKGPDGIHTFVCAKCDAPISDQVASFSLKAYGKRLCREHQPKKK